MVDEPEGVTPAEAMYDDSSGVTAEDTSGVPEETDHDIKSDTTVTQEEQVQTQKQTIRPNTETPSAQHTYRGRALHLRERIREYSHQFLVRDFGQVGTAVIHHTTTQYYLR